MTQRANPQTFAQTFASHQALLHALGGRRIGLFGSLVRGDARETSDLDFLVEFEPGGKTLTTTWISYRRRSGAPSPLRRGFRSDSIQGDVPPFPDLSELPAELLKVSAGVAYVESGGRRVAVGVGRVGAVEPILRAGLGCRGGGTLGVHRERTAGEMHRNGREGIEREQQFLDLKGHTSFSLGRSPE